MNSIFSLPASLRIVIFIFMMTSLGFLMFAIALAIISKREKTMILYQISLFSVLLFDTIVRTPVIQGISPIICDYLSLINLFPLGIGIYFFIKKKDFFFLIDGVWLLINITLFGFIPYYGYIASGSILYILLRSVLIYYKMLSNSRSYPGRLAIKYALDDLDEGVIFANSFHQITYLNEAMRNALKAFDIDIYSKISPIYASLLRKASRKIDEYDFIVKHEGVSYRFIVDKSITQIVFFIVTYEEELLSKEEENNGILSNLNKDLNARLEEADKIQKEKELLNVKGFIHDSLAQKLSILHSFLLNEQSTDLKEIKKMLSELDISENLKYSIDIEYLQRVLKDIGVNLEVKGDLPKNLRIRSLFNKAIKEGTTNAIRHGGAKNIKVEMSETRLLITNDGKNSKDFNYGNGLNGINIEAERNSFLMKVENGPSFTLILSPKE
ncbi:MAG: hypothetical protein K5694_01880 [Bacilli bacterium]|nr:hypothetical protein [Bacilli bacterium]